VVVGDDNCCPAFDREHDVVGEISELLDAKVGLVGKTGEQSRSVPRESWEYFGDVRAAAVIGGCWRPGLTGSVC
jgi:hypothetical protein